ncbi:MAG: hypothetical protein EPN33_13830 [Acidobacteria bacterium]|nr:MAG: hypothetical protein EPN33_13830 [Acidobacteriota bacterium]
MSFLQFGFFRGFAVRLRLRIPQPAWFPPPPPPIIYLPPPPIRYVPPSPRFNPRQLQIQPPRRQWHGGGQGSGRGGNQRRNFNTLAAVAAVGVAVVGIFAYIFGSDQPSQLPPTIMREFGFDPQTAPECPQLGIQIGDVERLAQQYSLEEGGIVTGVVNPGLYNGPPDAHFYLVATNAGNIYRIAEMTGTSPEFVRGRLSSMPHMMATWAGSMMAGGADVSLFPGVLEDLRHEVEADTLQRRIGHGVLTSGRDQVELSRPRRTFGGNGTLTTFLARTEYFHALSGSVLHGCYIRPNGDIIWFWCGAGGRGLNSRFVNNPSAINLQLGIWPNMARAMRHAYQDRTLMTAFLAAEPDRALDMVAALIHSGTMQRGPLRDALLHMLAWGGYPARIFNSREHGGSSGVKGE